MYCSHCGQQLFYKDLERCSWCGRCQAIVEISRCKVSFWNLMAVFTLLWVANVYG